MADTDAAEPRGEPEEGAPTPAPSGADPAARAHDFPLFGPVVEQLDEDAPSLRGAACWTLGQLRYGPAGKRLSRILARDEDSLVRVAAAQALCRIGGAAAAQALIRGLRDEDDLVRDACIVSLGKLGDAQGSLPLEEMLRKLRAPPKDLVRRLEWAIESLKRADDPGTTPDRRRGGVSKKIRRYLDKVHADPRDGIAHNNLAVAYFHAAEHELAVRHCLLAKGLGARVHWLWSELEKAGHDPAEAALSEEDERFLEEEDEAFPGGEARASVRLEPEPRRVELRKRRGADEEPGPYRVPSRGPYRVPDRGRSRGGEGEPGPYRVGQDRESGARPGREDGESRGGGPGGGKKGKKGKRRR